MGELVPITSVLPGGLTRLSVSSMSLYLRCPIKWKRRYIDGDFEPSSPAALLGSAVHRAEGENYQQKIETGVDRPVADVLDTFSDEYEDAVRSAEGGVDWEGEKPGKVKDSGTRVLRLYHELVAPQTHPVSVERAYVVRIPGAQWTFQGFLDLEVRNRDGSEDVGDLKTRGKTRGVISAEEAAGDLQVTANLFARRAESGGAHYGGFQFHNLVRASHLTPGHVVITPAHRTGEQLDAFYELLIRVAHQIARSAEYDDWTPAPPGAWWCSQRWCGFWSSCMFGGAGRTVMDVPPPRAAFTPGPLDYLQAVRATARRDGTTTAERVARHLGVSVRQASSALARHPRVLSARPMKGRGKERKPTSGPLVYREEKEVAAA